MRTMVEPPIPALRYWCHASASWSEHWKCRDISSLFVTLPTQTWKTMRPAPSCQMAAAREFAAKVMRGLVDQREDDWHGWTMEVREGRRRVWQLPFDAIEPASH